MPGALFFYGVLQPGLVSGRMAELVAMLGDPRPATVAGLLYAVPDPAGHYPILIPCIGSQRVFGAVMFPGERFGPGELAELDAFERFDPRAPGASDYVRRSREAELPDGTSMGADAYVWNRAIGTDFIPILHGNFERYLAETGACPLPG